MKLFSKWIRPDLLFPKFTFMLSLLTLGSSLLYIIGKDKVLPSSELLRRMGAPNSITIYSGEYWGIFTNSFTHSSIVLLILNSLGLWILGAFFERRSGWFKLFLLGSFASISCSAIQLTLSGDPGLGMTGVNYYMLGYLTIYSMRNPNYEFPLRSLALFIGVVSPIIVILANTYFEANIGLESIVAGFVLGVLFAVIKSKVLRGLLAAIVLVFSFGSLFYAPWNAQWNFTRAIQHHAKQEIKHAEYYYQKTLERNPSHADAQQNLLQLSIDRLADEAYELHSREQYRAAGEKYREILRIDPKNKWAQAQLNKLP